ncbi:penicillin acylase family protein [Salipiger thiooxidans]|uniref:penicillin acylase family protein n=1 Tax=Salipiger thiooxidans TaxID=282683 RepID=UPI00385103EE
MGQQFAAAPRRRQAGPLRAAAGHLRQALGGGSNNWAVSGDVTDNGEPILIGDPHRELEMPAMYAPAHAAGARFDSVGLTVPGGPGFPHAGHNAQVAWCVTHAMADIQDLFIERFKDGGRRSLHKGAWRETEIHEEILRVRGQDSPERVTIHRTCHGPVICGDPAGGGAITLASPQLSEGEHSFDCLPRMLRAGTVAELYEATRGWSLIDDNLVAADRDGHIGRRVRARLSCGTLPWGPSRACFTGSDKIHGGRSERPAPGDGIWCWSGHLSLAPVRRRARAAENGSDVASKLGGFGARIARRERSREVRASPAGGE